VVVDLRLARLRIDIVSDIDDDRYPTLVLTRGSKSSMKADGCLGDALKWQGAHHFEARSLPSADFEGGRIATK
jgi:hypothetical protein